MLTNTCFNTNPYLVHSPFENYLWKSLTSRRLHRCTCPENLTIVTYNNKDSVGLQSDLHKYKINFVLLGNGVKTWKHTIKINLLLDAIDTIKTPYILSADCYDVCIVRDLKTIVEDMASYFSEAKLVFNATTRNYPMLTEFSKQALLSETMFCHLNSGVWIGEIKYVKHFFQRAADLMKVFPLEHNDQMLTKKIYETEHPVTKIDDHCRLFQVLHLETFNTVQLQQKMFS
jgi:hypothetical protein